MLSQLSISVVAFLAASSAFACNNELFDGALKKGQTLVGSEIITECKQVPSTRKSQDAAVAYVQTTAGKLYRVFDIATKKNPYLACAVTSDVLEFKLSNHTEDISLAYFVRSKGVDGGANAGAPITGSVLYRLEPGADPRDNNNQCTSSKGLVHQIGYHIKPKGPSSYMFSVIPKEGSTAIVVGQHTHDIIAIWDKNGESFNAPSVADYYNLGYRAVDYKMNPKYMVKGAPGSTILVFVLLNNGQVLHVRDAGKRELSKPVALQGGSLEAHVASVIGR